MIGNSKSPQFLQVWSLDTEAYGQAEVTGPSVLQSSQHSATLPVTRTDNSFSGSLQLLSVFSPSSSNDLASLSLSCQAAGHLVTSTAWPVDCSGAPAVPTRFCWSPVSFASFFVLAAQPTLLKIGKNIT